MARVNAFWPPDWHTNRSTHRRGPGCEQRRCPRMARRRRWPRAWQSRCAKQTFALPRRARYSCMGYRIADSPSANFRSCQSGDWLFRGVTLCGGRLRVLPCNRAQFAHHVDGETHPMTLRTLRIITFICASHLLLISPAFTSQLPLSSQGGVGAEAEPVRLAQEVTIKARQQSRHGDVYTLDGDVEILFENYVLRAEHGSYNEATGDVEATGRVVFDGGPPDANGTASRAFYNVKNESATFFEVAGTFGARVRGQAVV